MGELDGIDLSIDHVIICVPDLEKTAERLGHEYGLESVRGGRHTGFGTENRIIPLGENYVELMSIADPVEAKENPLGQWASRQIAERPERPAALCLGTGQLDDLMGFHNLRALPMSRLRPDGVTLRWRLAGLEQMLTRSHPFFIEWDCAPEDFPGRAAENEAGPVEGAVVSGDVDEMRQWLGGAPPGISIVDGEPGVVSVTIRHPGGPIVL